MSKGTSPSRTYIFFLSSLTIIVAIKKDDMAIMQLARIEMKLINPASFILVSNFSIIIINFYFVAKPTDLVAALVILLSIPDTNSLAA